MANKKKNCWFSWMKRLFVSEENPKAEKKSERRRWIFGRLKFKQCPVLPAPRRTLNEATEKQRKYALTVALATAAAAEAAVAAAQAAAEVVRITSATQSHREFALGDEHLAAVKIQSAFRAYLARKALRALKGLVRLQAIVRGRAVRRQSVIKLKSLPSSTKMQSDVQLKSIHSVDGIGKDGENKQFHQSHKELGEKESKLKCNSQRRWECSILSKEDMEALWLKRQEAAIKRERMMKYSFSHRKLRNTQILEESVPNKEFRRRSHLLEQWAEKEAYCRERMENLKPSVVSNQFTGNMFGPAQVKTRITQRQDSVEGVNLPVSFPRRSFGHMQRNPSGDNCSAPNSPVVPTYMTATESAKAKARSISTPRQRVGFEDSCFHHSLSHKKGLSFCFPYNGESFGSSERNGASQCISVNINHHY